MDMTEMQPFEMRFDGLWNYFYVVFQRTSGTSMLIKLEITSLSFKKKVIF